MRVVVLIVLFLGAVYADSHNGMLASLSPLGHTEHTIPEEYIVVFKKDAKEVHIEEHMTSLNDMLTALTDSSYTVMHKYHLGNFRGYAARMDVKTLDVVRSKWEVDYVERNQVHSFAATDVTCIKQCDATWGLSRISHKKIQDTNLDYTYDENMQGNGVAIYIIDSGIDICNPEFEERAKWGIDLVKDIDEPGYEKDEAGHGTAVAGVAMSKTYGVAKKAIAIAVRVGVKDIDQSKLLLGYEWVGNDHKKRGNKKAVVNVSIGGPNSQTKSELVQELINEGLLVIAAAGNNGLKACDASPGSIKDVVCVAASDSGDNFFEDSNYGKCVNIIAPGVKIHTTGLNNKPIVKDGTSFAAPFVTGVAAKLLSGNGNLSPEELREKLYKNALKGKITMTNQAKGSTPNLLLNDVCPPSTTSTHQEL